MDLERKKREELEMEVLQLRGEQCCNTSSPFTRNDTDSFPVLLWWIVVGQWNKVLLLESY